jgi:hypothetical protein
MNDGLLPELFIIEYELTAEDNGSHLQSLQTCKCRQEFEYLLRILIV